MMNYVGSLPIYIFGIMFLCGAIAIGISKTKSEDVLYDLLMFILGIVLGSCATVALYDLVIYIFQEVI